MSERAFPFLRVNEREGKPRIVQLECLRSGLWGTKSL